MPRVKPVCVVGVLADVVVGGSIPTEMSIATANARERRRIPRFMMDTFGWRSRFGGEAQNARLITDPRLVRFRLPRSDHHANKEIFK
jgi:hypothetical protein